MKRSFWGGLCLDMFGLTAGSGWDLVCYYYYYYTGDFSGGAFWFGMARDGQIPRWMGRWDVFFFLEWVRGSQKIGIES